MSVAETSGAPSAPSLPSYHPNGHEQDGGDAFAPPAKRQRVSQACGTCRDRKTRCDGRQPVCSPCHNRGVGNTCRYDHIRRQRARTSNASSLQAHDHSPEADRYHYRADNDAAQALSDLGRSTQRPLDQPPSTPSAPPLLAHSSDRALIRSQPQPQPQSHSTPEWRGVGRADGLATIAAGGEESLYGPSSTVAFLRHVMPNGSRPGSTTPTTNTSDPKLPNGTIPDRIISRSGGIVVLPQRRQADNFVLCFWEFIHPLFPVLHKPTFTRKYDQLWVGDHDVHAAQESEAEEAIFNSILNLVFALGSRFSGLVDPAQRTVVADDFYQRSRQSYPFDVLDSTSISLVQMLILTAVFLQSTQHASRCWNSLGLAVRVAQSLGMHVDHGNRRGVSQLELQMRRRIWHTCIHLDRLLSMTFGRPSMIDRSVDVPTPDLIDDEYLSERNVEQQPVGVHSRLGLFVSSCKLFELLEEILIMFYRDAPGTISQKQGNGATRAADILTPILDLNRRLDQFAENVPSYLRVGHPEIPSRPNDDHINLQKQVLYCRFLYIRLLTLRPLLLTATRRGTSYMTASLDDEVIASCCRLCTSTACRLIDTLYDNLGTLYRSSGWHTVYFTFASAIVLLASSKLDEQNSHIANPTIEPSWTRCFAILEHYENQIQSASQAASVLRSMKARIADFTHGKARPSIPASESSRVDSARNNSNATVDHQTFLPMNLDDIDFFASDNMSSAWFGQQLVNLDWLDLPPV